MRRAWQLPCLTLIGLQAEIDFDTPGEITVEAARHEPQPGLLARLLRWFRH